MKVRVLGCSGAIAKDCRTTAFLIDDSILIDAGTGVGDLTLDEMRKIDHVFLTHSHLDHIAALPLMLDAVGSLRSAPVQIHALSATVEALRATRADVAFIGTNGIAPDHGFSTPDSEEAAVKRALVGSARTRVVLADSTKFGPHQVFSFAALTDATAVVTDDGVSDRGRAMLEELGVEVVVA